MSRTRRNSKGVSPIKKYIEFKGGEGIFQYYDKETKENITLESLDGLIVLDVRYSIGGYSKAYNAGINSNMVTSIGRDVLSVAVWENGKRNEVAKGVYKDIKPKLAKLSGAKFTQNVIALLDLGDGYEVVNVQLSGVGNSSWIEFNDKHGEAIYDYAITMKRGMLSKLDKDNKMVAVTKKEEGELDKKLSKNPRAPRPVWFYTIEFEERELTEEEADLAIDEDEKLQNYFNSNTKNTDSVSDDDVEENEVEDEDSDESDLPF